MYKRKLILYPVQFEFDNMFLFSSFKMTYLGTGYQMNCLDLWIEKTTLIKNQKPFRIPPHNPTFRQRNVETRIFNNNEILNLAIMAAPGGDLLIYSPFSDSPC